MRLAAPARRRAPLALTALVDVVFILLFFFMLAARPPAASPRALLLTPAAVPSVAAAADPLLVLLPDGALRLDATVLRPAAAAAQLQAQKIARVRLRAEPGAPLDALVAAFEALRAAQLQVELAP